MNDPIPDPELDALFARARAHRPDTTRAEYAFETRLMARLREKRPAASVWATVSWRFIPFFAACVVALTIWQTQVATQTEAAEQLVYVDNPNAFEGWNASLDL
jgi:hypothetical protein